MYRHLFLLLVLGQQNPSDMLPRLEPCLPRCRLWTTSLTKEISMIVELMLVTSLLSTRSSPSAENKLKIDKSENKIAVLSNDIKSNEDVPKPQRQPKITRSEKVSVKDTLDKPDNSKIVKKPESLKDKSRSTTASIEKPDAIQLPSFPFKDDDPGELDFIYDEDLAKFTEEKMDVKKNEMSLADQNSSVSMPIVSSTTDNQSLDTNSPTSPAAQDLNQKIASVKTFWDNQTPMSNVFDQGISSSGGRSVVSTATDVSVSDSFSTFNPDMDTGVMQDTPNTMDLVDVGRVDENNSNLGGHGTTLSPRDQEGLSFSNSSVEVSASLVDNKATEQSNVCKVKPQQLQQQLQTSHLGGDSSSGNSSVLSNPSAVPSPPSMATLLPTGSQQPFQAFQIGSSQLVTQEPRVQTQPSFGGYGLSQQQPQMGQNPFSQQSLFLPTTPTQQPDSYQLPQLSFPPRNQQPQPQPQQPAFGQTPTPQNTIMVSSSTSSLMSTSIKPPAQNAYGTTLQKNIGPSSLQFGQQGLNNNLLQPSISFFQYEPSQPFGTNQFLGNTQTAQNVNSNQILGSQLVQQRPAVQNVQPVQGSSSFYQQPQQNIQQTSFFSTQPASSNMQPLGNGSRKSGELMFQACILQGAMQQGALQQAAAAGAPVQFSMQTFGNQPAAAASGLNLPLQPSGPSQPPLGVGVAPAQPTSANKVSQFNQPQQQQGSPLNTPLKSPPQSLGQGNFGNPSVSQQQNQGSKLFNLGQLQNPSGNQRFSNVNVNFNNTAYNNNMKQFGGGQKFNQQFVPQQLQSTGPVVRPQMMVNNFRPSGPPPSVSFPNPIQRPGGVQIPSSPRQQRPAPSGPVSAAPVSNGGNSSLKAQQAKQRQELLAHAQSFLNPQNKPSIKIAHKAEASISDKKGPTQPPSSSGTGNGANNTKNPHDKNTDKQ